MAGETRKGKGEIMSNRWKWSTLSDEYKDAFIEQIDKMYNREPRPIIKKKNAAAEVNKAFKRMFHAMPNFGDSAVDTCMKEMRKLGYMFMSDPLNRGMSIHKAPCGANEQPPFIETGHAVMAQSRRIQSTINSQIAAPAMMIITSGVQPKDLPMFMAAVNQINAGVLGVKTEIANAGEQLEGEFRFHPKKKRLGSGISMIEQRKDAAQ